MALQTVVEDGACVPHWTAVCCAVVSIKCPPWCPRLGLYSTPPLLGPGQGGLFRCQDWNNTRLMKKKKKQEKCSKTIIQPELSHHADTSQNRWDSEEMQPRVICVNLVMDMLCDSICWGKWVIQQEDGESRWSSTRLLAGYNTPQTDRTTEAICVSVSDTQTFTTFIKQHYSGQGPNYEYYVFYRSSSCISYFIRVGNLNSALFFFQGESIQDKCQGLDWKALFNLEYTKCIQSFNGSSF